MTGTPLTGQALTIPGWLPARATNIGHRHWAVRHRVARAEQAVVWAAAVRAGWVKIPGKVRLSIELVFPTHRVRDLDNLHARVKHTIDGLKPFFHDDSTDWLELHVQAEVVPSHKETRITLEALDA